MGTGIEGRRHFLVEYSEEGNPVSNSPECREILNDDFDNLQGCHVDFGCKCQDARNNTYTCLRSHDQDDTVFCEFQDKDVFMELYSLTQDKFQLTNIARSVREDTLQYYKETLDLLRNCRGAECNGVRDDVKSVEYILCQVYTVQHNTIHNTMQYSAIK